MNRFLVFSLLVGCALAAPYTASSSSSSSTSAKSSTVAILKHIQQINDDGSYTFGYENADGSYRVENRDVNGYITGKYGYIDGDGKLQETEYVAGKLSGRSVGYQARGSLIPIYNRQQLTAFPVVRSVSSSTEQRGLDYEYKSVDADEDGFPDDAPVAVKSETYQTAPVVVRVVEQSAGKASGYGSKTVTNKVQEPKATYEVEKVRIVEPSVADDAVKTVEYSSSSSSSESATASSDAVITDVRTPAVESEKVEVVQVVETSAGTAKYVQPTVVRLVATETEPSVKQVVVETAPRQQTSQLYKVNQSVFRLPTAATNTYETVQQPVAKVVEKKVSVGRLDAFLRELVKNGNNVRITYQQPAKSGSSSYYAQQPSTAVETTLVADDDSIDIDAFGRII